MERNGKWECIAEGVMESPKRSKRETRLALHIFLAHQRFT